MCYKIQMLTLPSVSRRNFLRASLAAPAIIAIDRLMPVKLWKPDPLDLLFYNDGYGDQDSDQFSGISDLMRGIAGEPVYFDLVWNDHAKAFLRTPVYGVCGSSLTT